MAEEIKGLIEKIQQEGIKAAEDRGKAIEQEAQERAEEIKQSAKKDAEKIIADAKDKAAKIEANTKILLKQASRDVLINLRKGINTMLDKMLVLRSQDALGNEELAKIISSLITGYRSKENGDIRVLLKKEDLAALEKNLFTELKEEIKKGITIQSSGDITGGFTISYDRGKSHFDFTDQAIAAYIGTYLKPKLREILEEMK
ncbi:MAG: hypothetical protein ABH952_09255 [Candidatus Omnitrophota bacterium]